MLEDAHWADVAGLARRYFDIRASIIWAMKGALRSSGTTSQACLPRRGVCDSIEVGVEEHEDGEKAVLGDVDDTELHAVQLVGDVDEPELHPTEAR